MSNIKKRRERREARRHRQRKHQRTQVAHRRKPALKLARAVLPKETCGQRQKPHHNRGLHAKPDLRLDSRRKQSRRTAYELLGRADAYNAKRNAHERPNLAAHEHGSREDAHEPRHKRPHARNRQSRDASHDDVTCRNASPHILEQIRHTQLLLRKRSIKAQRILVKTRRVPRGHLHEQTRPGVSVPVARNPPRNKRDRRTAVCGKRQNGTKRVLMPALSQLDLAIHHPMRAQAKVKLVINADELFGRVCHLKVIIPHKMCNCAPRSHAVVNRPLRGLLSQHHPRNLEKRFVEEALVGINSFLDLAVG